jgi:hypothetical protein
VYLCAHFQPSPRTSHRQAIKQIFRYLWYTPELGLWYSASFSLSLLGFSDADFAGCRVDRKSTSGTCQFLGSWNVSWSARKQSSVAQSTIEAEYVAAASCCSQLLPITNTLSDFGEECSHVPLTVAKNHVLHSRTKHIEVRYHFLRDNVEKGNIDLIHVPTEKQLADILTKPLGQATFARLRGELGVIFPFWASVGRVDVNMHVAFSSLYHIMFASFYHRLHVYHMPWRCASLICIDHLDMLEMRSWLCLWCSWDV